MFIARYGHIPFEVVQAMELPTFRRYLRHTKTIVYAERGLDENGNEVNASPTTQWT